MPLDKDQTKYGLFPALLKYWRGQRGLSQLDLGLAAEVSARHISFIETARSQASEDMVLRLATVLNIPLRDQNTMLRAAGFEPRFPEPLVEEVLEGALGSAVERMLDQHEPYPMAVMNRVYDVVRTNVAATKLLALACVQPPTRTNLLHMLFDPKLARSRVLRWEETARTMLTRLHRETLHAKNDVELRQLLDALLEYDDVPEIFRTTDLGSSGEPVVTIGLRVPANGCPTRFSFLTTITAFNAPLNVTLEELRIESYFPIDDETDAHCRAHLA